MARGALLARSYDILVCAVSASQPAGLGLYTILPSPIANNSVWCVAYKIRVETSVPCAVCSRLVVQCAILITYYLLPVMDLCPQTERFIIKLSTVLKRP